MGLWFSGFDGYWEELVGCLMLHKYMCVYTA